MAKEKLELRTRLKAAARRVYDAWLDAAEHARFTGADAASEPRVGGAYRAWDGYIEGRWLELEPGRRIVATWRTTEFPEGDEDSRLELVFDDTDDGTVLTLLHTDIPEGQGARYESGWDEFYFQPLAKHFEGEGAREDGDVAHAKAPRAKKGAKQAAAKKGGAKKGGVKKAATKQAGAKKAATKKPAAKKAAAKKGGAKKAAKRSTSRR